MSVQLHKEHLYCDLNVSSTYFLVDGTFYPLEETPKMKERKGGAK